MTCAGCGQPMTSLALAGHYGRTVTIDLCNACAHVWFDDREDLHLAPGGVVVLFEAMARAVQAGRVPVGARKPCPRCQQGLMRTNDRLGNTPFVYFRCAQGHGRLMAFAAFLRARKFVRDLSAEEVRTLRVEARVIKCVNCGAATDITTHSACAYCQAPIAILDADQLSKTLGELAAADTARAAIDPTWPLRAEQVRRQTEAAFAALQRGHGASPEFDLIETGVDLFARLARALRAPGTTSR